MGLGLAGVVVGAIGTLIVNFSGNIDKRLSYIKDKKHIISGAFTAITMVGLVVAFLELDEYLKPEEVVTEEDTNKEE